MPKKWKPSCVVYDKNLIMELECPVCTEVMHPPIRQCIGGHSLCSKCYEKMNTCPICRRPLSAAARSIAVESIHHKFAFTCKNKEFGCKIILGGAYIVRHETKCPYVFIDCLMASSADCVWSGKLKDMHKHLKSGHKKFFFNSVQQNFIATDFLTITGEREMSTIFHVYSTYFRCNWKVNIQTGVVRWWVYHLAYMGSSNIMFQFTINIIDKKNKGEPLQLTGRCPTINEQNQSTQNSQSLETQLDLIKNRCENNDMHYSIKIIKQNQ